MKTNPNMALPLICFVTYIYSMYERVYIYSICYIDVIKSGRRVFESRFPYYIHLLQNGCVNI